MANKPPKLPRVYHGKNGFTSTFTTIKVNQGTKTIKEGGSVRPPRKKK